MRGFDAAGRFVMAPSRRIGTASHLRTSFTHGTSGPRNLVRAAHAVFDGLGAIARLASTPAAPSPAGELTEPFRASRWRRGSCLNNTSG